MKNIILSASILLAGFTAGAQNGLKTHLPAAVAANIAGANVTVFHDQSILVRYTQDAVSYKIYYSKEGVWQNTIASYGEAFLPAPVRNLVKSNWHGWNISFIDEWQSPGADPLYRVQLTRDRRLTIIDVTGDTMTTEKELSSL